MEVVETTTGLAGSIYKANVKRNLSACNELNVEFSLPKSTTFGGALPLLLLIIADS
jgi:hypothetical protein